MGLGYVYAKIGEREKALECISKIEQRQREEPGVVVDADLAAIWFGLGDIDKAFYYINKSVEKRMAPASYFLEYPAYKGVKSDPRYKELLARIEEKVVDRVDLVGKVD